MGRLNKKYKISKNVKRLSDALVSNACNNQIEQLKENLHILNGDITYTNHKSVKKSHIESNLLDYAIKFCSKDVAEYLIPIGAKVSYHNCIDECKYDKIKEVYELIQYLESNFGSFDKCNISIDAIVNKIYIIERLIDPEKVIANKDRLNYTIDLIRSGFIKAEDVRKIASSKYEKKESYITHFKMMTRELFLNELGI